MNMVTANKSQTITGSHKLNDWSFLPTLFSALTGVGIGLIIGNYIGLL